MDVKSPFLTKMLCQNYYFQEDMNQQKLGSLLLQMIYRKISDSKQKQFKEISQILVKKEKIISSNQFGKLIIKKLQISTDQHLKMCLGEIIQKSKYQDIKIIEKEIFGLLQEKTAFINSSSSLTMDSFKANKSSSKSSISTYQQPLTNFYNQPSLNIQKMREKITYGEQLGLTKQQEPPLKYLNESIIMKESQKTEDSLNLSSFLKQTNPSIIYDDQQTQLDVEYYIKTLEHQNIELNLLVQKYKFKQVDTSFSKMQDGQFSCTSSIQMFSIEKSVKITATGKGTNKKASRRQCSKQLLLKIYSRFPNLCKHFQKLKKKQAF